MEIRKVGARTFLGQMSSTTLSPNQTTDQMMSSPFPTPDAAMATSPVVSSPLLSTEPVTTSSMAAVGTALCAYLLCKPCDADAHLRAPIRMLVSEEGGIFSNGSILAFDKQFQRYTAIAWPKAIGDLTALVAQTAEPIERGGQASRVMLDLLCNVAIRLYTIAETGSKTIRDNSSLVKMTIGLGDEAEEVGDRYCVYTDPSGTQWTYTPHSLRVNLARLQPTCMHQAWFQTIALKPEIGDSLVFDELDGTIRCGAHIIVCMPTSDGRYTLHMRAFESGDRMLLDAGHDLVGVDLDYLGTLPEVVEARAMMEGWMGERTDFWLVSLAERLLLIVRKEAYVFETPSDRGKSTLLAVLEMAMGTYARRMPNAAVSGANKRMAPVAETTLSRAGVRFMLHDEVDVVDWLYLKEQSNATQSEEWDIGMASHMTATHKATRILTRNATKPIAKVIAAPRDCRRKIVLWTGATLHAPAADPERYARIQAKDPTLARGVFLCALEAFQRLGGKRPVMPDELFAGDDLVPAAVTAASEMGELDKAMATLTLATRRTFHELYRTSTMEEGGTPTAEVQKVVCAQPNMLPMLAKLSLESFTTDLLQAGRSVIGDPEHVPTIRRGYIGATGEAKRQRVNSVMLCLPK